MAEARGVHHRALPSATVPRLLVTAAGAHTFGGQEHPVIVWRPDSPFLAVATTALGGGVGERAWVLSATVDSNYAHPHPPDHLRELAARQSLRGDGIGFLTAVDVPRVGVVHRRRGRGAGHRRAGLAHLGRFAG